MKRLFNILLICIVVLISLIMVLRVQSCAHVKSYQQEKLADPIINHERQFSKQNLDAKFFQHGKGVLMMPKA